MNPCAICDRPAEQHTDGGGHPYVRAVDEEATELIADATRTIRAAFTAIPGAYARGAARAMIAAGYRKPAEPEPFVMPTGPIHENIQIGGGGATYTDCTIGDFDPDNA